MQEAPRSNFIWDFIDEDLAQGRYDNVRTRFPPEPNGYLHIGHCKAICVDFLTAQRYGGMCNLRFDDTNPTKEDVEYVDAIQQDIRWLGFHWHGGMYYASDYFSQMYELARKLIRDGNAFVCDLNQDEMRRTRGTLTQPGVESPYRNRSVEENLDLFARMRAGEFPDGSRVLRAKIDMASPNINMRDPAIYRIVHAAHHRTGDAWCIYPMYDYAHPIEDALENITYSLCSLEFENHRPLYDWVVEKCGFAPPPRQIEFARLNLTRTIMSKRYLRRLVEEGHVAGWDDPRMPTIAAMRRRGYTPAAIRDFIDRVGVSKADSEVDFGLLEHCVREDLGDTAARAMAVLRPLKVTLTNWPEGQEEQVTLENHPDHPEMGERRVAFGGALYIDRDDFMENPPKKFFRLFPGGEVRLKGAYIIRCDQVIHDAQGNPAELRCTVDLASKSGQEGAARKVKGTLHWVNAAHAVPLEARLYAPLLLDDTPVAEDADGMAESPVDKKDFVARLNPESLTVCRGFGEPALAQGAPGDRYQFLRVGYFAMDADSAPGKPIYNRIVSLKDTWANQSARQS
ncbi:MAG: glutamine--tRNA ligase/YqeY domain fusion protein [Oscillospiraceae bacterium]|jgi:glutaminyl-tRNA synthetase|nr:glutamine--tRNA ligase/YqeY domain fusion protein [Oscillospiraceae bacterium]